MNEIERLEGLGVTWSKILKQIFDKQKERL